MSVLFFFPLHQLLSIVIHPQIFHYPLNAFKHFRSGFYILCMIIPIIVWLCIPKSSAFVTQRGFFSWIMVIHFVISSLIQNNCSICALSGNCFLPEIFALASAGSQDKYWPKTSLAPAKNAACWRAARSCSPILFDGPRPESPGSFHSVCI